MVGVNANQVKSFQVLFIFIFFAVISFATYTTVFLEDNATAFYVSLGVIGVYVGINKVHLFIIGVFYRDDKDFMVPVFFAPLIHYFMHTFWVTLLLFILVTSVEEPGTFMVMVFCFFFFTTVVSLCIATSAPFDYSDMGDTYMKKYMHITRYKKSYIVENR